MFRSSFIFNQYTNYKQQQVFFFCLRLVKEYNIIELFFLQVQTTETSLPSEAEIELPPIHMYADYRPHKQGETPSDKLGEGLVLKEGDFLHAVAEIGMLEHSLTTDLLNHLVFVQKVFMKVIFVYC